MIEQTNKSATEWLTDNIDRLSTLDFRVAIGIAWLAGFKKGLAEATKKETPRDE